MGHLRELAAWGTPRGRRGVRYPQRHERERWSVDVAYVTIQFPEPSETFATNEVRVLSESGVAIAVHGMRRRHPDADQLLRERGLTGLSITHNGVGASARGLLAGLVRPGLLLAAVAWIVRVNLRNTRDMFLSLLLLPRAFDILAKLERRPPDVVHMYWGHFPTLVGYLVQRRLPSIVTSLSIVAYDLEREYGGAVEVARHADVVRTHARANVERIVQFTGIAADGVNVIYNGVDIAWLERIRDRHEKVQRRVVAAGRLTEKKGMAEVLEAFSKIRARWPDATLIVLGDGPDRPRLRALCETLALDESVEFRGHVAHARAIEEMAKAEVFMLLSRSDGERLPNVVKEAMACRCVCITTPTPGISELVEHEVTGFVVPASDPHAASKVVDDVFAGRIDVARLTTRAWEHVAMSFDLRRTALSFDHLWRAALQAGPGPHRAGTGVADGGLR
jgi:glycosyltransferase involved in cell wall biosynthesis